MPTTTTGRGAAERSTRPVPTAAESSIRFTLGKVRPKDYPEVVRRLPFTLKWPQRGSLTAALEAIGMPLRLQSRRRTLTWIFVWVQSLSCKVSKVLKVSVIRCGRVQRPYKFGMFAGARLRAPRTFRPVQQGLSGQSVPAGVQRLQTLRLSESTVL